MYTEGQLKLHADFPLCGWWVPLANEWFKGQLLIYSASLWDVDTIIIIILKISEMNLRQITYLAQSYS